jgi:hypothetical protein
MVRYVRGTLQRIAFLWRYDPVSAFNSVISIFGFVLLAFGLLVRNTWAQALALLGTIAAVHAWYDRARQDSRYFLADVPRFPPEGLEEAVAAAKCRLVRQGASLDRLALVDDELNALLWNTTVVVKAEDRSPYRLPDPIDKNVSVLFSLRRTPFDTTNESKIRLRSPLTSRSLVAEQPLLLQKTDYFSGILTHEMSKQVFRAKNGAAQLDGTIYYFRDRNLVPLDRSAGSNHIGVTTLALTSDLCLVYQVQKRNQVDPGRLAASGSGSLDWEDIGAAERAYGRPLRFGDLLRFGVEREPKEEVSAAAYAPRYSTHLTGYARLLDRGGKPDFYALTILGQRFHDLRIGRSEEMFVAEIHALALKELTKASLIDVLDQSLAEHKRANNAGMPFYLAMYFARDRLVRDPAFWDAIEKNFQSLNAGM